ncbi:MAG: hypothetical protein V1814_00215 [Candidatus Moraniibacteriota bacterium]
MKRFFLYFLLLLLIAGLAALAFGFYNAKKIRAWAGAAAEIKSQHDVFAKEKNIESRFDASGGEKMEEFKREFASFSTDLDSIVKETETARKEIGELNGSVATKSVRAQIDEYYQQSGEQAKNIASVVKFMSQLFEVRIIFDRITPDSTLEEIKGLIGEAKSKNGEIDTEILPTETKDFGVELKTAIYNYLDTLDQYAAGKIEGHNQLNASYMDFSQKENDFREARKNLAVYVNIKNLDSLGNKIDSDLMVLRKVKFSIK